jgi:hypothetical protein
MKNLILIGFLVFGFELTVFANTTQKFYGKATRDGKLIYTENHQAQFDKSGQIQSAKTEYLNPEGKLIATLKSDFSKSITAPSHDFEDLRFAHKHGIRYTDKGIELYSQEGSEKEQTKLISSKDKSDGLLVGCQGLGYYFRDHLDQIKNSKVVPILFLIPGSLDTYDFELVYKSIDEKTGLEKMRINIKNWFLRLFAPHLDIEYDPKTKRMVSYKGLSNLYDDNKKQQNVDIQYIWE